MSGLDIRYEFGEGHPLLGRRMPDLDLVTATAQLRVFALLHSARPLLLSFDGTDDFDIGPWSDRLRLVAAKCDGPWELPAIGEVAPPTAVLVRPDGYVAWVGERTRLGLVEALTTWLGPP
jgi:3-(3-hydroxy-phenyl)propionate hydroxylase